MESLLASGRKAWQYWLSRRSWESYLSWEKFERLLKVFPLPHPKIIHQIGESGRAAKLCVGGVKTLITEEPDALIAHVRVCGGAGWVTTGSTRNRIAARWRFWMDLKGRGGAANGELGVSGLFKSVGTQTSDEENILLPLGHRK